MSFKGFTKAITRAPQTFRQKFNMGEQTEDPVYQDAERRFQELEDETKKLSEESKRYSTAVNGMLTHQIGFAKAMEEIFKPISGQMSDPNAAVPEDNPDGIEASEQYRSVVAELQETLKPDLALIDDKIIKPCQELLKIITYIRKMATKRNHKKLDLDRRLNTYTKLENKKEPTAKDEEKTYKAHAELEVAQHEYDYYNEMMKEQLPVLFGLEAQFVQPLFVSFYYMQLNIFYTLYNKFQDMKIPYFDLDSDIVEAFQYKRGNVEEQADALTITNFKIGYSKAKLEMTKRRFGAENTPPGSAAYGTADSSTGAYGSDGAPAYGVAATPAYCAAGTVPGATYGSSAGAGAYGAGYDVKTPPTTAQQPFQAVPPAYNPVGAPTAAGETCIALYDYQAQAAGDLSFPAGAVIEIVERTANVNEWWTGRYNGMQGVFPGNYVQL